MINYKAIQDPDRLRRMLAAALENKRLIEHEFDLVERNIAAIREALGTAAPSDLAGSDPSASSA